VGVTSILKEFKSNGMAHNADQKEKLYKLYLSCKTTKLFLAVHC
jgi:hypothetical protein